MARRHKLLAGFLAVLVAGVALAYLTIDDEAPAFESPGENWPPEWVAGPGRTLTS